MFGSPIHMSSVNLPKACTSPFASFVADAEIIFLNLSAEIETK